MPGELRFVDFPQDDRSWRLDWVGPIYVTSYRRTPVVRVQLSAEQAQGRGRDQVFPEISIWTFPKLHVGRTWTNGKQDARNLSYGETTRVVIDAQPGAMRVRRVYDHDGLSYAVPAKSYPIASTLGNTYVVIFDRPDDCGLGEVVVPCTEIFRAYFGHSSRIVELLLRGVLVGPNRDRLFDPNRCYWQDGVAFVTLGMHVPNSEAQTIARIAFDPLAFASVQNIVRATIAASKGHGSFNLLATPPIRGRSCWTVRGVRIGTPTNPRFLVQQIVQCSVPPPFNYVLSYRDNQGGLPAPRSSPQSAFSGVMKRSKSGSVTEMSLYGTADPDSQYIPLSIVEYDDKQVTPRVPHEPLQNLHPQNRSGSRTVEERLPATRYSAGSGVIGSNYTPLTFEMLDADDGDPVRPGTLAYFRAAMDLIESAADEFSIDATVDVDVRPMIWPSLPPYQRALWSLIEAKNPKSRPRRVAVAFLNVESQPFVLFEIERRANERDQPTLIIRGSPTYTSIGALFFAYAHGQGQFNSAMWKDLGLSRYARDTIHHNATNTPGDYAKRILGRLVGNIRGVEKSGTSYCSVDAAVSA